MRRATAWKRPLVLALLGLAAAGCASGQGFLMPPAEYGVYRQVHAGKTLEDRLTASYDYITQYPDGVYIDEVRGSFLQAEALYYAQARRTIKGLEAYLLALPRGPHSQ